MPVAIFCLFFYFAENQCQTVSKQSETFLKKFLGQKTPDGPKKYQSGAPRGAQPNRACLAPLAHPSGWWPPWATSRVLLQPILALLVHKKYPKSFAAFGLRLVLNLCVVKNKQKTTTGTGHYVNRLVPKNAIKLL